MLMQTLDIIGTFVFALSGGARGVERKLDPFGVVFLAFVAAVSGGLIRDVLMGALPPAAITAWPYLVVSTVAGLLSYFFYPMIKRIALHVQVLDAIGLGLFSVAGAEKAVQAGLPPLACALLGMLTGIGGGLFADVLTAQTPMILRREIYALPALLGASFVAFGPLAGLPLQVAAILGGGLAMALRLFSIYHGLHLPPARN